VGGGTVTKTLTGTGAAQAVVLTATDVGTLGNGLITVTAGVADPAGNTSQASTTFTLDTVAPNSPTLALGTGVANGATAAEATQATGVVRVTAETGAAVTVTFSRVGGGTVTKTLTGSGIAQAVVLTAANVTTLGNGLINVSATQVDAAGNAQTDAAATTSFSLDTVAPNAPTLALGTGVALGATAPEATQATGVVRVTADAGAVVTVTFSRVGGGTVTKTLTGTGAAQAVVLTAANLTTLGNGVINVAATQVDAAGNAQTGAAATTSFTLDTVTPTVTGVTSAVANGTYGTGQIIPVQVRFSEAVVVTGTPTLALNTTPARTATYASGGGTNTLVFNYVIQLGDTAARLDQRSTTALALNGGTIVDAAGNDAVRTLAAPGTAGSLGASKVITVAGVLKATVAGFGTTSPGPAFTTAVTRIPITFNAPVTGFTLASLKLFYQDRPVSLAGATLTGSGANYVLTLPRTTASLRGRYRLDIGGPGTGIVSGGVPMSTKTSIYWQRI
jgi:type II secretory pathway component PulM